MTSTQKQFAEWVKVECVCERFPIVLYEKINALSSKMSTLMVLNTCK